MPPLENYYYPLIIYLFLQYVNRKKDEKTQNRLPQGQNKYIMYHIKYGKAFIMDNSTIAATATPAGKGGVAIVRISGENAHVCLDKVFKKENMEMRKMYYGGVYDGETLLDKCLCVKFDKGASYTGEKTAEIQCHGGYACAQDILGAVLKSGARMAENGEFTRRAFLSGRIDLSQAEAVGDMIEAETKSASRAAARLLSGALGEKIRAFQDIIKELLTEIEAGIDYPEEMDEELTRHDLDGKCAEMLKEIEELADGYERGRITKDGLKIAIIGKPNAGKSSLLNVLCGCERAIVTPIAGTTRDTLHEVLDFSGVKVHLYDTAGIRESADEIEQAGVERSRLTAKDSDAVLCIIDSGESTDFSWLDINELKDKRGLFVFNKSDIKKAEQTELPLLWESAEVSAVTGEGIEKITGFIEKLARESDCSTSLSITSSRHYEALSEAKKALTACRECEELDMASIDLTNAWTALGVITGQTVTDDIIDNIFKKFCVGK